MSVVVGIMAALMIAAVIGVIGGKHHMVDGGHKEGPAAEVLKEKAQDCPECPL